MTDFERTRNRHYAAKLWGIDLKRLKGQAFESFFMIHSVDVTMFRRIFLSLMKCCASFSAIVLIFVAAADSRGADKIRIGYGALTVHYAPIWVAGDAQLYRKNGL